MGSELQKLAPKNCPQGPARSRPAILSRDCGLRAPQGEVHNLNLAMEVDQAQPLAHGHPSTLAGDMFPFGNLAFGDGSGGSLFPILAGEFRSHSAVFLHLF